jgi:hypothetical protein
VDSGACEPFAHTLLFHNHNTPLQTPGKLQSLLSIVFSCMMSSRRPGPYINTIANKLHLGPPQPELRAPVPADTPLSAEITGQHVQCSCSSSLPPRQRVTESEFVSIQEDLAPPKSNAQQASAPAVQSNPHGPWYPLYINMASVTGHCRAHEYCMLGMLQSRIQVSSLQRGHRVAVLGKGCVPWVCKVVCKVVEWALASGSILRCEAQEGQHRQAAVPDLLPLVLLESRGVPAGNPWVSIERQ